MSRYIDADAFEVFGYNKTEGASEEYNDGFDDGVQYVLECIDNVPTADVVEVVRCEDCIYKRIQDDGITHYYYCALEDRPNRQWSVDDTDFCFWGERREDGEIH